MADVRTVRKSEVTSVSPLLGLVPKTPSSHPSSAHKEKLFTVLSTTEVQRCEKRNSDLAAVLDVLERSMSTPVLRKSLAFEVSGSYATRRTFS